MEKKIDFWVALFLAVTLGAFGVQEFYVKNTGRGILGVIFAWTGIPTIVALVQTIKWAFMGKENFENKYNKK